MLKSGRFIFLFVHIFLSESMLNRVPVFFDYGWNPTCDTRAYMSVYRNQREPFQFLELQQERIENVSLSCHKRRT
jgi:hypothetical protein